MADLEREIKELIVEALSLDVSPEDIETDAPLFGEGLGLDSIDALEIAVALEERYGVSLDTQEDVKSRFSSVAALAELVRELSGGAG